MGKLWRRIIRILIFPTVLNGFSMEGCLRQRQQQQHQHHSHRPHKINVGGSWRVMVMAEHAAAHPSTGTTAAAAAYHGGGRVSASILYRQVWSFILECSWVVLALERIGFQSNLLLERITTSLQARAIWICLTYRFMEESYVFTNKFLRESC